MPAASGNGRQTRHVRSPLIAVERVEQPAIEHRLEHSIQPVQVQGIGSHEVSVETANRRLLTRARQRGLSHINAENV
jgi:hypothetical protein